MCSGVTFGLGEITLETVLADGKPAMLISRIPEEYQIGFGQELPKDANDKIEPLFCLQFHSKDGVDGLVSALTIIRDNFDAVAGIAPETEDPHEEVK